MMRNLYTNFIRGVSINIVEWIAYNIVFTIHQIALLKSTDISLFGQQGVLFALLYTTIGLSNLGLDLSLAPFFSYAHRSKKNWRTIITTQLVIQLGIMSIGSLIALYFYPTRPATSIVLLFMGSTLTEGLRKLMKVIMHLSSKHSLRISLELGTLIVYVLLVWIPYLLYNIPFSLYALVFPFFIATGIGCIISALYVYAYYRTLPNTSVGLPHGLVRRIIIMRCNTSLYSVGHQIFSGNMLLPYIALHSSFSTAGVWTIIQTITQTITNLMHKISGFTGQAYLSQVKRESVVVKQQTFSTITNILNQIIYATLILLCVVAYTFVHKTSLESWLLLPIIMYISITIIEQWVATYEKFYLNEEHSGTLALLNGLLIASSLILIKANFSLTIFLALLLVIRIISFVFLMIMSYRLWHIRPDWRINIRYFALALILMIIIACIIGYKLIYIE